jgi:hypothetical protein
MPVHDWTRVEAGIFHDFHVAWIAEIRKALNGGLLPEGYYALAEQHAGQSIADVLTLHSDEAAAQSSTPRNKPGGTALAGVPPKASLHKVLNLDSLYHRRRTLAIRHVSGHRLVAVVEILSPAKKARAGNLDVLIRESRVGARSRRTRSLGGPFSAGFIRPKWHSRCARELLGP